ncbi:hypothetical protein [Moraxella nasicaprae]|uniref:Uncharacterized protein n=1 Tax=Moraxella nasicaprae TaxID=2904122 RepID=A0ABY6F3K5_9GAMM|nr:hypothetical protein [Moraxella nasicaprae]UXZ04666.1 hypothetical protein LU297_08870 [Moraxella nasicaprae]
MPLPLLIGGALLGGALLAAGSSGGNHDDDDDEDLEEARREKACSEILTSLSEYLEKEGNQLMSILAEQGIVQSMVCKSDVATIGKPDVLSVRIFARNNRRANTPISSPSVSGASFGFAVNSIFGVLLGNSTQKIKEYSLSSFIENSIQNIDLNQVLDKSDKKSELGRVFATSKKWTHFAPKKGVDTHRFIFQRVTANFYSLYDCVLTPTDEFCQDMELLSRLDDTLQKIKQEVRQINKSLIH